MIYSNMKEVHDLCAEYGIKCAVLPSDLRQIVSVSSTYIFVQEDGFFNKISDIKELQKRIAGLD